MGEDPCPPPLPFSYATATHTQLTASVIMTPSTLSVLWEVLCDSGVRNDSCYSGLRGHPAGGRYRASNCVETTHVDAQPILVEINNNVQIPVNMNLVE